MMVRYSHLGSVIVCGDMNGTLVEERNNGHDKSLKDFVREHNLTWRKMRWEISQHSSAIAAGAGHRLTISCVLVSQLFRDILEGKLSSSYGMQTLAPGEKLDYISDSLREAAYRAAQSRMVKLRVPRFKASPAVKNLLEKCTETHITWKENGSRVLYEEKRSKAAST